jgi:hypothetical protein
LVDNEVMMDDDLEPPPVPLCSKALVATLKRRLHDAIETGKAGDAKIFVDIIERLAKMDWLDDLTPQERFEANQAQTARALADVDLRLARFLQEQQEQELKANK